MEPDPVTRPLSAVCGLLLACALGALLVVAGCQTTSGRPSGGKTGTTPPVAASGIRFSDTAEEAGLRFQWNSKPTRPLRIIDALGVGCAFFDLDNDGDQDVLLVSEPSCGLFLNDGQGRFKEITAAAGLDTTKGAWKACAIGDYDGDGWLDLLLSGYRCLALLRNQGGTRFSDATRAMGLDPRNGNQWGTSAGFMDLDRDGDLDLVVQNYVVWGPQVRQLCEFNGVKMGCPPKHYQPEKPRLYRNDGGKYTDVSRAGGLDDTTGVGLVVGFDDANDDGKMDFYLGNDAVPADFMQNSGGMKFRNVALMNGTAYAENAQPLAAMGVDFADYDRDGRLDFSATAFSEASYALFHNEGHGVFTDISTRVDLAGPTFLSLGFGVKFVDVDNDAWPDLFYVNGHVYDAVNSTNPQLEFRQPSMLFHNEQGKHFTDLAPSLGGDLVRPIVGRGSATGDVDNDGRMDLLVVDYEGKPLLLRNQSTNTSHWLKLDLRGSRKNRFAYGAHVTMRSGSDVWVGEVSPVSSYLSSSDPRLHFGLGTVSHVDSVTVRWPEGRVEEFPIDGVDRIVTIREGEGKARAGR